MGVHVDLCRSRSPAMLSTTLQTLLRWILVALLSTVPAAAIMETDHEEMIVSSCFHADRQPVVAHCRPGYMVKITEVFYGHSANGTCRYTDGDCKQSDDISHNCVGQQVCEVNLPTGNIGRVIPHCKLASTYLQMSYQCIPGHEVYDICRTRRLEGQQGYLRTPNYPNNYPRGMSCNMTISAYPGQRIKLYIIDLDLGRGSGGCTDILYIKDELHSSTRCGPQGLRPNDINYFNSEGSALHITFNSDSEGLNKGFWLYFKAYPPVTPTTTLEPSTTQSTLPPTVAPPRDKVRTAAPPIGLPTATQQEGYVRNITEPAEHLPLEAIVGGLLGTLLCILLVLLILLIIKRRKERESMPPSTSTCFLHSKQPIPGPHGPYIQNNLALVDDAALC